MPRQTTRIFLEHHKGSIFYHQLVFLTILKIPYPPRYSRPRNPSRQSSSADSRWVRSHRTNTQISGAQQNPPALKPLHIEYGLDWLISSSAYLKAVPASILP